METVHCDELLARIAAGLAQFFPEYRAVYCRLLCFGSLLTTASAMSGPGDQLGNA